MTRVSWGLCLLVGCASAEPAVLESVTPQVAQLPQTVTLSGVLLSSEEPGTHVVAWTLDEAESNRIVLDELVQSWTDTQIELAFPADFLGDMYDERPFALHVEHGGSVSNGLRFDAVLPPDPRVVEVSPPAGRVGVELTIVGLNFGDSQGIVRFAPGVDATINVWSDEQIRLDVPEGGTGGSFVVQTALGLLSRPQPFFIADPNEPTLSLLQATLFSPRCALGACHGTALAGGLSLVPGQAYEQLVSVGSSQLSGTLRVEPFSAETSLLIDKLENMAPAVGGRMPLGGPYLSETQINLVRAWIDRGAMND